MSEKIFTKNQSAKTTIKLIMLGFMFFALGSNLQAQCNLACNDLVHVSLDGNCEATITPEMMLEDMGPCTYTVVVYQQGTNIPIPGNIVNGSHVGKKLRVSVFLGNNQCWGHILVEDKLPPVIRCPENDTFFCHIKNPVLKQPYVVDACSSTTRIDISDEYEKYPCDSAFAGKRTIMYAYRDIYGNISDTCTQCVYFKWLRFGDIAYPRDTILPCETLESETTPDYTGKPTIDGVAIYPHDPNCNIGVKYEDEIIPICPTSYKILRKWIYVDWCIPASQGGIYERYQVIKVLDDRAPIVVCPPNQTISTDVWTCTGTVLLPPPTVLFECSSTTFTVFYKIADPNGEPTTDGASSKNVTKLPNGYFRITDLPLGLNWIIFKATDACNNSIICATEVLVEDKIAPVAVCDKTTVVSLTIDGTAKAFANYFDDGSHDNCALDKFEVKRMDNGVPCNTVDGDQWKDYVLFCCDDIGKTLMVSLRVTDKSGNTNTCMIEVQIQDKTPPIIVCPPHITVSCEFDFKDYSVFGNVVEDVADREIIKIDDLHVKFSSSPLDGYAYDGCGVSVEVVNRSSLTCNQGPTFRTFTATDLGGLKSTCTQIVTVTDYTLDNINVFFPPDYYSFTVCANAPDLKPEITGRPIVTGKDKCSQIMENYEDKIFTLEADACIKILRKWTIIDWCVYRPNEKEPNGYWTWTQVIKVVNTVPPTITSNCANITMDVYGPGCGGELPIIGTATDDCTAARDLKWSFEVDFDNDGTIDTAANSNNATMYYPVGTHYIKWSVKDGCDNETWCEYELTVVDKKKPTPYCHDGINTAIMPSTGTLDIWASDFNLNSEDNCTHKRRLKYFFLINGQFVPSMTLDCSNKGVNTLRMYVMDEAGNYDYCEVELTLQDPNGYCKTGFTVNGNLLSPTGKPLTNVAVTLDKINPPSTKTLYTNDNGVFTFNSVVGNFEYNIFPGKNDDHLNGVTTNDIVFIQRHILDLAKFTSPYKYMAADANNDGKVSAVDISEIRKLILGKTVAFPGTQKSWRFISQSKAITESTWAGYSDNVNFKTLQRDEMNTNFYGVKIGDLNESFSLNVGPQAGSRSTVVLQMNQSAVTANQEVRIPVIMTKSMTVTGLQFAVNFDADQYEFVGLDCGKIECNEDQYNLVNAHELRLSYANANGVSLSANEELITIILRAKTNKSIAPQVTLSSSISPEIYNENHDEFTVRLDNNTNTTLVQSFNLIQNKPNPFSDVTTIGFEIPEAQVVTITVMDVHGKILKRISDDFAKGYNEVIISKEDLAGSQGVLYYQMDAASFTSTKRMVFIR